MGDVKLNAKQVASDVLEGMDDKSLMNKYGLSENQLTLLFEKLVSGGHLRQSDIDRRVIRDSKAEDTITIPDEEYSNASTEDDPVSGVNKKVQQLASRFFKRLETVLTWQSPQSEEQQAPDGTKSSKTNRGTQALNLGPYALAVVVFCFWSPALGLILFLLVLGYRKGVIPAALEDYARGECGATPVEPNSRKVGPDGTASTCSSCGSLQQRSGKECPECGTPYPKEHPDRTWKDAASALVCRFLERIRWREQVCATPTFDLTSMSFWSTLVLPTVAMIIGRLASYWMLWHLTYDTRRSFDLDLVSWDLAVCMALSGPIRRPLALDLTKKIMGSEQLNSGSPTAPVVGLPRVIVIGSEAVLFCLIAWLATCVFDMLWARSFPRSVTVNVTFLLLVYYVCAMILSFVEGANRSRQ